MGFHIIANYSKRFTQFFLKMDKGIADAPSSIYDLFYSVSIVGFLFLCFFLFLVNVVFFVVVFFSWSAIRFRTFNKHVTA